MSRSIITHGQNWTQPSMPTAWQRERAEPALQPAAASIGIGSWIAIILVSAILWTAIFALVFS